MIARLRPARCILDMLDSLKSGNEYIQKMAATFLGLVSNGKQSRHTSPGDRCQGEEPIRRPIGLVRDDSPDRCRQPP